MKKGIEPELLDEMVRVCRLAYSAGHVAAAHGNVSARAAGGVVIKASGVSFAEVTRGCLLFVDGAGRAFEAETMAPSVRRPSIELGLHEALYELSPETRAVVHTHSPHAVAMSVLYAERGDIPLVTSEGMTLGRVPIVGEQRPGSPELAGAVRAAFAGEDKDGPKIRAAVIARHGPVAIGGSLRDAYNIVDNLEHNCRVAWLMSGDRSPGISRGAGIHYV